MANRCKIDVLDTVVLSTLAITDANNDPVDKSLLRLKIHLPIGRNREPREFVEIPYTDFVLSEDAAHWEAEYVTTRPGTHDVWWRYITPSVVDTDSFPVEDNAFTDD